MELTIRKGNDAFVPPGAYRELEARLRSQTNELAEVPAVVLSCFDRSTRLLPFVLYDSLIFPAGARVIASALYQAGFTRTRAVFQLWNPAFRPSSARLDGRPIQLLLVSSMEMHAGQAYEAILDAHRMGADRPLIIAGGPKAVYQPYHYWKHPGKDNQVAPDVVVTGEAFVLLDFLNVLLPYRGRGETMRVAFERARRAGALESVPGLVYLAPEATPEDPLLVDTGLQRLVQHLDEMPHEATGLGLLEPPHRRAGLSPQAIPDDRVRKYAYIVSLLITQGCKFNCPYCPIPALNQKSWRFRSPEGLANEIRMVQERYGIEWYFGTDDNFFNRRETAEGILTALARAKVSGKALRRRVRWSTESTQFDAYKNRDLLPLAREAGLYGIWFGIEDLTADLINKGQKPEVTIELFRLLHQYRISPMAMLMFHEGQPFYTRKSLYGLANQVDFLRRAGAISIQCTVHNPAVGTREVETTYRTGRVLKELGDYVIPESKFDGNHVMVDGAEKPWLKQLKLLGGYAAFYNPLNFLRALKKDGTTLRRRRIGWQLIGTFAVLWTAWKVLPYMLRLLRPITYHTEPMALATVPVRVPEKGFSRLPADTPLVQLGRRDRSGQAAA
ncbi:MAG: B12-binding domain-containing radical SAM protein [Gemmataceae bacterium]